MGRRRRRAWGWVNFSGGLFEDSAGALGDKFEDLGEFWGFGQVGTNLIDGLLEIEGGAVDDAIGLFDLALGFFGEAVSLEADFVVATDFGGIAVGDHKRGDILDDL